MYTVASPDPDPNPRRGGQLPNLTECNSTLTSGTEGETLTPNPNDCHSMLTSAILKVGSRYQNEACGNR